MKRIIITTICMMAAMAFATPTVMDVVAKQRYPWGLVDITCKVSGMEEGAAGLKFVASAIAPDSGITNRLSHFWVMKDGVKSQNLYVDANGDYRLLWDAKADLGVVRYTNMVVSINIKNTKVQLWADGPYWATTNIGAEEPWESGYYFWWGDTIGYKRENDKWVASDGSYSNFSFIYSATYNKIISTLQSEGWITAEGVLAPEHDAAHVHWGGDWRMPTYQELYDLCYNKCNWTWTTQNGVNGYIVRGRGEYASNSIFLPCAGYGLSTSLVNSGSYYWSSVPDSDYYGQCSRGLWFNSGGYHTSSGYRYSGHFVRPVQGEVIGGAGAGGVASFTEDDSVPFQLDTEPLITEPIMYNSAWVEGDQSAEVVIAADGTEIKRITGEGEFIWSPTALGKYSLSYTTYIDGVEQDEVYTATVFKDWKYTVEDGKATIVETTQTSGEVAIPSEIDGFPVVALGDSLFNGCEGLTSITMLGKLLTKMSEIFPDSYDKLVNITLTCEVTEIPENAFAGCAAMETFVIPDGVTQIGDNAFSGCTFLKEIVIPDSVYSLGENAFANCTELKKVTMPFPLKEQVEAGNVFAECSEDLEIVYRAAEINNVVAKQRYPWNGKVDIAFTVDGDVTAGLSKWDKPVLSVSVLNQETGSNYVAQVSALSGDTGTAEGVHHIVWDLNAQGLEIKSDDMVFTVAYTSALYCVIDLSTGKSASTYPVTYLTDVPAGGWTDEHKTTKLVLRRIEPGSFKMNGSYNITLTKAFYCGVFEVTQKQYELVTGVNKSNYKGDNFPVQMVSWNIIRGDASIHNWPLVKTVDGNSFVGVLREKTGLNFDLPTEAQWEYACKAGGVTDPYWGDLSPDNYAWYGGNSEGHIHEVGRKVSNNWGLYDMHGNVAEWVLDASGDFDDIEGDVSDYEGPIPSDDGRVLRGGSFAHSPSEESFYRFGYACSRVDHSNGDFGFRVVSTVLGLESEQNVKAVSDEDSDVVFYEGRSPSIAVDMRTCMMLKDRGEFLIAYNSAWIGGDSSAEVVIAADGSEIKRTTGEDEFTWSPTVPGKHTLTYTTYIDGVAQDEVYTAIVFKDWKYTVEDGKATIVETTQTSGNLTIPSEIDGYPVVGIEDDVFAGCTAITSVTMPMAEQFTPGLIQVKFDKSDDFTSSIADSDSKSLVSGVLMGDAYDTESVTHTYTDPKYGGSYQWNSRNTTFGYLGYMHMVKGRTYVFGKYFDDSVLVRINGTEVLKNTDCSAFATGYYIPENTGWHEIEVRVSDGYGEKGPRGMESSGYWSGNLGVGWRDDGITDALPESGWNKMMDSGDGSLFRIESNSPSIKELFPDSFEKIQRVELTGDVKEIPTGFFEGCVSLESFVIPDGVTRIGANAFAGCESLATIVIPDSVYCLGANAFANCTGLKRIEMPFPLKVQIEAGDVFVGCVEDIEIVYRSAEIKNVVAKQRYPWNGKVDISFEVAGDVTAGLPEWNKPVLSVSALNQETGSNYVAQVSALSGDTGTAEGVHHIVWDLNAQGLEIKSDDMVFTVAYTYNTISALYCVIDLSTGVNAEAWAGRAEKTSDVNLVCNIATTSWRKR